MDAGEPPEETATALVGLTLVGPGRAARVTAEIAKGVTDSALADVWLPRALAEPEARKAIWAPDVTELIRKFYALVTADGAVAALAALGTPVEAGEWAIVVSLFERHEAEKERLVDAFAVKEAFDVTGYDARKAMKIVFNAEIPPSQQPAEVWEDGLRESGYGDYD
jgi:hypothetical protein